MKPLPTAPATSSLPWLFNWMSTKGFAVYPLTSPSPSARAKTCLIGPSARMSIWRVSLSFSPYLLLGEILKSQCPSKVTINGTFQDFCPSFLPCPIIRAQMRVRPSAAEHTGEVFCILHAPRTRPVAVTARIEHSPLSATKPISSSPSTGAIMKLQSLFSALFAAIMLTRLCGRAIRARRWGTATRLLLTGANAAADEHAAARIASPSTRMLAFECEGGPKKRKNPCKAIFSA